jgi:hypothetical protein
MESFIITKSLVCAFGLLASHSAHAVQFVLNSSAATTIGGNTTSVFYEVTGANAESGPASGLYSSSVGGDANTGFFVSISFGSNPQPVLTSAFLKASNQYLLWDNLDLAAFNSGTFDSIILWNNGGSAGIQNGNNKYHGTSHAGLNGMLGTTTNVPDGGATMALLGLSLFGMTAVRKAMAQPKA